MPMLNNCCGCCTLKTGSLVLGTLSLIGSVIGVITCAVILSLWTTIKEQLQKEHPIEAEEYYNVILAVLIILLIFTLFGMLIDSLLLYGINNERPGMMLPYIILSIIGIILNFIGIIMISVQGGAFALNIVGSIVGMILSVYFTAVIYSHYQEVRERQFSVSAEGGVTHTKY